ncbi:MAG TPA: DUF6702 family protein [Chitinophagaceae bacterium]|nr:DUF6702 family protein [Chitinophagaceae bacterium]
MKISRRFVILKTIGLMASSVYKWLFIPQILLAGLCNEGGMNDLSKSSPSLRLRVDEAGSNGVATAHPFHVSVVEINHNATDKTLEITCKIFTDDFEKVLAKNYQTKIDLINPPDKTAMDTVVKKYIVSHLSVSADGKPGNLVYIGFERDAEAVYSYVQAENISSVKKIDIVNRLMHDLFDDQINIIHVTVNGNRKSTKLDYPTSNASISF